jgi:hypothetical protein
MSTTARVSRSVATHTAFSPGIVGKTLIAIPLLAGSAGIGYAAASRLAAKGDWENNVEYANASGGALAIAGVGSLAIAGVGIASFIKHSGRASNRATQHMADEMVEIFASKTKTAALAHLAANKDAMAAEAVALNRMGTGFPLMMIGGGLASAGGAGYGILESHGRLERPYVDIHFNGTIKHDNVSGNVDGAADVAEGVGGKIKDGVDWLVPGD